MHKAWTDIGEEMSRVRGAVVVRRPDLIQDPGMLAPANSLDFVQTLQSYFTIFKSSLFPGRCDRSHEELQKFTKSNRSEGPTFVVNRIKSSVNQYRTHMWIGAESTRKML